MKSFQNKHKTNFIASIPTSSIEGEDDVLTTKCKFNFAYFDIQPKSQSFEDWTKAQQKELFNKLKAFSKESLQYWKAMPSKSGRVLSVYGAFPQNSDFRHPKHVPHDVEWGRFRLDCSSRLVGFVLPAKYSETKHLKTEKMFDCNTFYVVFLDAEHCFYKGKEAK